VNRKTLLLSRIQREGESFCEGPLLWGQRGTSGRVWTWRGDLAVADVGERPGVKCGLREDLRLSPWTRDGPVSMSSLLFA